MARWNKTWNSDLQHSLDEYTSDESSEYIETFGCMSCTYKTTNDEELTNHYQKNHLDKHVEPEMDLDQERNSNEYTSDESSERNDPGIDADPDWKSKSKSKSKSKLKSKSKSKLKSKSKSKSNKTPVIIHFIDERILKERCKNYPASVVLIRQKNIPPSFFTAKSKSTSKSQPDANSNQKEVTMPSTSHNNKVPSCEWEEVAGGYQDLSEQAHQIFVSVNEPDLDMNVQKNHLDKIVEPVEPEREERNVESAAPFQGIENDEVVKFFEATENLLTVWEDIKNSERDTKFFKFKKDKDGNKPPDRTGWSWSSISNNGFLQEDGYTEKKLPEIAMEFLNQCDINLPEIELEQYARLVLIPQVQVHLLMVNYQMTKKNAEHVFRNYRAPEDEMEENLQMAQAPTFDESGDDIPDYEPNPGAPTYVLDGQVPSTSRDVAASAKNHSLLQTGKGKTEIEIEKSETYSSSSDDSSDSSVDDTEPVKVHPAPADVGAPTYVLDGQVPSTSARAKNLNLLNIDLSDFKRPKKCPKNSRKGGKNPHKKKECNVPEIEKACIECKQIFCDKSGLGKHIRFKHPFSNGYAEFTIQCECCDKVFTDRREWHNHRRTVKYKRSL